ncbi:GNAT family N-acetyltransferase [Affinibrenneria salicis]|uniref:GNAT family N-acetyltransferase n=1 Tax=Affinibrenneria salicis TaxID=2590031 RepID=A0A5J5FU81_9GAMM|nr:GNAT family N-acetyltransferase [Affinibrenneria salicis]KAA8997031.1 GNAT family N-acetyltransferase [Affinibrenneria salicis]
MQPLTELYNPPHLRLCVPQMQDAGPLFTLIQREKARLRHTMPWPDSVTQVSDSLTTIEQNRQAFSRGQSAMYLIFWDEELVGVVSFNTLIDGEGVIGYWISSAAEGKGIAFMAVNTLIDNWRRSGGLTRFVIRCSVENPRSNRLAQRLGFTFSERAPQAERIGARVYDQNIYRYRV